MRNQHGASYQGYNEEQTRPTRSVNDLIVKASHVPPPPAAPARSPRSLGLAGPLVPPLATTRQQMAFDDTSLSTGRLRNGKTPNPLQPVVHRSIPNSTVKSPSSVYSRSSSVLDVPNFGLFYRYVCVCVCVYCPSLYLHLQGNLSTRIDRTSYRFFIERYSPRPPLVCWSFRC